jgi:hypothetical protein
MKHEVLGMNSDLHFPSNVDPEEWRNQPDPDGTDDEALDNDDDLPAQSYIISALGFDPDETTNNESDEEPEEQTEVDDHGFPVKWPSKEERRGDTFYDDVDSGEPITENFNPSQPRGYDGKWSSGGGGAATKKKDKASKALAVGDTDEKGNVYIGSDEMGREFRLTPSQAYGATPDNLGEGFMSTGEAIFNTSDPDEILSKVSTAVGIPPNSKVQIVPIDSSRNPGMEVSYYQPDAQITAVRNLRVNKVSGTKEITNEYLKIKNPEMQGHGLGTRIFADQVDGASSLGFSKIHTHAAGDLENIKEYNGYYTWPRLGYEGYLPKEAVQKQPSDGSAIAKATKVSHLMQSKEGIDWWKQNGSDVDLTFDLKPGSYSRTTLDNYMKEKGML